MEPWKSEMSPEELDVIWKLQWGHGDGAVEEADPDEATAWVSSLLQWGHGDGAVEELRLLL